MPVVRGIPYVKKLMGGGGAAAFLTLRGRRSYGAEGKEETHKQSTARLEWMIEEKKT